MLQLAPQQYDGKPHNSIPGANSVETAQFW